MLKKQLLRRQWQFILMSLTLLLAFCYPFMMVKAAVEEFRVVGYLPDYDMVHLKHTVDFKQMTDINYFSMVPTSSGSLKFTDSGSGDQLTHLVTEAHKENVRVGVSIGGWGLSDNFSQATSEENRPHFVKEIVRFAAKYKLDTIDIDWEYPSVSEAVQFTDFMKDLRVALPSKVDVTICVPSGVTADGVPSGNWEQHFTPEALAEADWINVMSYDAQSTGYPNHSPLELHEQNLTYWNQVMGGNHLDKLVIGIPFYGKALDGSVLTYQNMIAKLSEVPTRDDVEVNGTVYYFNNKETISKKTQLSIDQQALGVMIWAPTQDVELNSPRRLTDVITGTIKKNQLALDKTVFPKAKQVKTSQLKGIITWKLFFTIIMLGVLAFGLWLFSGRGNQWMPDYLGEKKVKKEKFGPMVGLLVTSLSILVLIAILFPWYVIMTLLVALAGAIVWLLKN